jgi:tRNA A-37 threonylcarbamoyl transferase component Bud32
MTQGVSVQPSLAIKPPRVLHNGNGEYQWWTSPDHAALAQMATVDWFRLDRESAATEVKRNSQREVYRVRCGDTDYFAKVYHPVGWATRVKLIFRGPTALREWRVGQYAAQHSIAAVLPVAAAWSKARSRSGPSVLITEALSGVEPLNDHWLRIRNDRLAADSLAEEVARLIARAHQCGFQHRDMHPGNILVRQDGRKSEAFFVDLHDVRVGSPVSLREAVANLAQLNQWFRRHATRTQRRRFLTHYMTYRDRYAQASPFARNWRLDPPKLIADLTAQADRHANRLWAKRDRRADRDGRYFARIRPAPGWRGHVLLQSKHPTASAVAATLTYTRRQWKEWLRDPLDWVNPRKHRLLKDSHTATVCEAMLPTRPRPFPVIVKRPLARTWWKRLEQLFGRSRNQTSWRTANMLLNRALPAAQPLAVVERYWLGLLRLDSLSITDFVPASADLETFLTRDVAALDHREQRRVKDALIEALVGLLRAFHERGFVHRDMKAGNLLVTWPAPHVGKPVLTFVDMDGIRHVRRPGTQRRLRAIARLRASLIQSPACTRTDVLRFLLRHLTAPGHPPARWKDEWKALQDRVELKLSSKDARRRWKVAHYGRE